MTLFPYDFADCDGWTRHGVVVGAALGMVAVRMPGCSPGYLIRVTSRSGPALVQVRSVDGDVARCAPLDSRVDFAPGDRAESHGARAGAFVGAALLANAVDGWGRSASPATREARVARASAAPPQPADRGSIRRPIRTGVSAIDAFITLGYGQRVALFAGAGVGKSALLRRIVAGATFDARVVALVGERGREARETVDALRATPVWSSTTVVCAPAGSPPLERIAALHTATAHAEWLCARGLDVVLVVDSLTRAAHAWRELALAGGEPPAQRGYPPSVTAHLAAAVERAGARRIGTITAVYAVLVDGDDLREPVSDAVRGMLDGHIVLERALADAGRFPAIDVLRSLSRLAPLLMQQQQRHDAALARRALDALERAQDLFAIGAYRPGGDPTLDSALVARAALESLIFDGDGPATRGDPAARLHAAVIGLQTLTA